MGKSNLQKFKDAFEFAIFKAHKSLIWLESFDYKFIIDLIKDKSYPISPNNIHIWNNADLSERDLNGKNKGGYDVSEDEWGKYVIRKGKYVKFEEGNPDGKRYRLQEKKRSLEDSIVNFVKNNDAKLLIARITASLFEDNTGRVVSALQEFVYQNSQKTDDNKKTILLISSNHFETCGLEHICERLTVPLPDRTDIMNELGWTIENGKITNPNVNSKYEFTGDFLMNRDENYEELVNALYGMYLYDIRELLRTICSESKYNKIPSVIDGNEIDEDGEPLKVPLKKRIEERKKQMVKNNGLLEVIDYEDDYYKFVADIDGIIYHIEKEKDLLETPSFLKSLLPKPKGILLVGAPGCGKSESAKAVASKLKLPLYRLNIGELLGHKYGQSENQFIESLRSADASAPCVLWIDEIEKAFAGAGNEQNNDNTLTHIVGYFLTWMQEHPTLVYLVATANNLSKMRPEMLRKGRWDEIFFLTYPSEDGCKKIFVTNLLKYKLCYIKGEETIISKEDKIEDLKELIKKIDSDLISLIVGMSGAEISNMIVCVAKDAFREGKIDQVCYPDLENYLKVHIKHNTSDTKTVEKIDKEVKKELRELQISYLGKIKTDELKTLENLLREKYKDEIQSEHSSQDEHSSQEYESKGYIPANKIHEEDEHMKESSNTDVKR